MVRIKHTARQFGQHRRGGHDIFRDESTPAVVTPISTKTTLVHGQRCSICPRCMHQVRVGTAQWTNLETGVRDGQPWLVSHSVEGTKTRGVYAGATCAGTYERPTNPIEIYYEESQ